MSFLRHAGIYRSDVAWHNLESWCRGTASRWSAPGPAKRRDGTAAPCSSSAMSSRAGYSLAGCSPAEPASASPTALSMRWGMSAGNYLSANGNLSLVSVSQRRGAVQTLWTHRFSGTLWQFSDDEIRWRVQVVDFKGDGRPGVVVACSFVPEKSANLSAREELFCFAPDGTIQWTLPCQPDLVDYNGQRFEQIGR